MASRESFLDFRGKLRPDVRALKPLWPSVQAPAFKSILMAVVKYLEQPEVFTGDAHAQLVKSCGMDGDALQTLFTGLLLVVRAGVRSRHKPNELKQDVEEELKMPAELSALLVSAIQSRRETIEGAALKRRPRCVGLQSVDWRVEVTISTGSLNRVLKPSVLMGLTTDEPGAPPLTFEMTREKFQELRYQVAAALKTMQTTEANPILKIE